MKTIYIFNKVPFSKVNKKILIKQLLTWAGSRQKKLVLNMNAYGVATYLKNENYAKVINEADLVYADGWGPVLASRLTKNRLPERINVGDYIDELLKNAERLELSIYMLGGTAKIVRSAVFAVQKKYPNIKIAGYHRGFFTKKDNAKIVKSINKLKPHIVFVGMGLPKQELWIESNWKILPKAIYMGVGSVFEYIAGKSRAPVWMRNIYLEWLYRLVQEPKRLWRRYTVDNIYFLYELIKSIVLKS